MFGPCSRQSIVTDNDRLTLFLTSLERMSEKEWIDIQSIVGGRCPAAFVTCWTTSNTFLSLSWERNVHRNKRKYRRPLDAAKRYFSFLWVLSLVGTPLKTEGITIGSSTFHIPLEPIVNPFPMVDTSRAKNKITRRRQRAREDVHHGLARRYFSQRKGKNALARGRNFHS